MTVVRIGDRIGATPDDYQPARVLQIHEATRVVGRETVDCFAVVEVWLSGECPDLWLVDVFDTLYEAAAESAELAGLASCEDEVAATVTVGVD